MPVYEYWCLRCKKLFTATLHVAEHDQKVPGCPGCKKRDKVERRLSSFTAVTSKKSAAY